VEGNCQLPIVNCKLKPGFRARFARPCYRTLPSGKPLWDKDLKNSPLGRIGKKRQVLARTGKYWQEPASTGKNRQVPARAGKNRQDWKIGRMEEWNIGMMGDWKDGRMRPSRKRVFGSLVLGNCLGFGTCRVVPARGRSAAGGGLEVSGNGGGDGPRIRRAGSDPRPWLEALAE